MAGRRMGRAEWMGSVGQEIYAEYYQALVLASPARPVELITQSSLKNVGSYSLIRLADQVSADLEHAEYRLGQKNPLLRHVRDIKCYTNAKQAGSTMVFEESHGAGRSSLRHERMLRRQNQDTLLFAHRVAAGTINEVLGQTAVSLEDTAAVAQGALELLQNPAFPAVLSTIATTGFGTLGSVAIPGWYYHDLIAFKRRVGFNEAQPAVFMTGDDSELGSADLSVAPQFQAVLRRALAEQNGEVSDGDISFDANDIVERNFGQRGFSRGCPVAKGGTFALLSAYMAETVALSIQAAG